MSQFRSKVIARFNFTHKQIFLLTLLFYLMAGIILLPNYQYQINPDGVSYISIARKYLHGDFANAINGYWGPILSWLLVPFLFFQLPPLLAAKLLFLIVGLVTFWGIRLLSYRFEMAEKLRSLSLFSMAPLMLSLALGGITPDLLLLCVLVYYFAIIFKPNYNQARHDGVICGLLGGISYLIKSYGFPFFILHFLLFNFFHYIGSKTLLEKRMVQQNFIKGIILFFIICGGWIGLISNKYGKFTISPAANYNFALTGPEIRGLPMVSHELIPPPNSSASTAWEDPTYDDIDSWNPLDSMQSIIYLSGRIWKNFRYFLRLLQAYSPFSLIILLAAFLFCLPLNKKSLQNPVLLSLITLFVYTSGYMLFFILARYLWVSYCFIILFCFYFINLLSQSVLTSRTKMNLVLVVLILSFYEKPLQYFIYNSSPGKNVYLLSRELKENFDIKGNIASSIKWEKSSYLAFHNNYRYLGTTGDELDDDELEETLSQNNIAYYFVWDDSEENIEFLEDYEEITDDEIDGLRIYQISDEEENENEDSE